MISKIRSLSYKVRRFLNKPKWHDLRCVTPISDVFGLDRGTPIDRYYIERFLEKNRSYIKGHVLEVAENIYTQRLGTNVHTSDVLHYDSSNKHATIVGDLTSFSSLPQSLFDCFICTQTLNFIFDVKKAIQGIRHLLCNDGRALITVAGICQISRYDMERWGDFWRFSKQSALKVFTEVFGEKNVEVASYGNVLSCVGLLEGISFEELTKEELDYNDEVYQMVISIIATKRTNK